MTVLWYATSFTWTDV